ncbi:CoA transferase [Phenylobacterium sp.]|uniref:CaiB/BaiF CoA transferase family protein n=1 Tax=Phenylobacterium sp. TaxID=1871053 RepID=UPI00301C49D4
MRNAKHEVPAAPLEGIRVVDLTSVIMGPFGTRILADMGADVIKVEPPEGDGLRPATGGRIGANMLNLYRNKRSITLDLKTEPDRERMRALIRTADVLVHNLRPQVMARLGFTYAEVRRLNPDIVYCAAHGFGSDGPYGHKPAYDDLIQASSGYASTAVPLTGEPAYASAVICDKLAGQAIAYAILGALLHRERGGGGQAVEVPMFETAIDFNLVEQFGQATYVPARGPPGYPRIQSRERRPFRTADGYACILPYSAKNWFDFLDFVGRSDWKSDDRFRERDQRNAHIDILYAMIREEAPKRTTAEWVAFCDSADIPCMPVIGLAELADDPHVQAVGLMPVVEHPTEGPYHALRSPIRFSKAPYRLRRHAPGPGQDTEEILRELEPSRLSEQGADAD